MESRAVYYVGAHVTPEQAAKLRELAERTERSQAAVLRVLLDKATLRDLERMATRGGERPESEART